MTECVLDGEGMEHFYCQYCSDEIMDTLESYDNDEADWEFFDPYEYEDEETSEEDQEVSRDDPD